MFNKFWNRSNKQLFLDNEALNPQNSNSINIFDGRHGTGAGAGAIILIFQNKIMNQYDKERLGQACTVIVNLER